MTKLELPEIDETDYKTRLALIELRLGRLEGSVNKLLAATTVAAIGLVSSCVTLLVTGIVN